MIQDPALQATTQLAMSIWYGAMFGVLNFLLPCLVISEMVDGIHALHACDDTPRMAETMERRGR
jgi:hypothetical protein